MIVSRGFINTRAAAVAGIAALGVVAGVSPIAQAGDRPAVRDWAIADVSETASDGGLDEVVAVGPKDAWAFGDTGYADGGYAPVARHWNGRSWTAVALPSGLERPISAADASGPGNVWAFGGGDPQAGDAYALRWDGHRWRVMGRWPGDEYIGDAAVLGPRDVWAFGNPGLGPSIGTWHFDGHGWKRVETPVGVLSKASAVASDDIWGIAGSPTYGPDDLLARWDGRTWNEVNVPGLPREDDHNVRFGGIHATSSHDVWVVGQEMRRDGETETYSPLALHFDGHQWQLIDPPPVGPRMLYDVTSDGRGGIWVTPEASEPGDPELLHYGQGRWTAARLPRPDGRTVSLGDVTAVPRSASTWAVGRMYDPGTDELDNVIWVNGAPPR